MQGEGNLIFCFMGSWENSSGPVSYYTKINDKATIYVNGWLF